MGRSSHFECKFLGIYYNQMFPAEVPQRNEWTVRILCPMGVSMGRTIFKEAEMTERLRTVTPNVCVLP
jgi:hypothetical protein